MTSRLESIQKVFREIDEQFQSRIADQEKLRREKEEVFSKFRSLLTECTATVRSSS